MVAPTISPVHEQPRSTIRMRTVDDDMPPLEEDPNWRLRASDADRPMPQPMINRDQIYMRVSMNNGQDWSQPIPVSDNNDDMPPLELIPEHQRGEQVFQREGIVQTIHEMVEATPGLLDHLSREIERLNVEREFANTRQSTQNLDDEVPELVVDPPLVNATETLRSFYGINNLNQDDDVPELVENFDTTPSTNHMAGPRVVFTTNGLTTNGLTTNGLTTNGLTTNNLNSSDSENGIDRAVRERVQSLPFRSEWLDQPQTLYVGTPYRQTIRDGEMTLPY